MVMERERVDNISIPEVMFELRSALGGPEEGCSGQKEQRPWCYEKTLCEVGAERRPVRLEQTSNGESGVAEPWIMQCLDHKQGLDFESEAKS